jgi:hypothetical protein
MTDCHATRCGEHGGVFRFAVRRRSAEIHAAERAFSMRFPCLSCQVGVKQKVCVLLFRRIAMLLDAGSTVVCLDLLCDVGRLRYTLQNVLSLCVFRATA